MRTVKSTYRFVVYFGVYQQMISAEIVAAQNDQNLNFMFKVTFSLIVVLATL